jgi:hypothetical protein
MSLDDIIRKSTTRFWESQGQLEVASVLSGVVANGKRKSSVLDSVQHDHPKEDDKENNEIKTRSKIKRVRKELFVGVNKEGTARSIGTITGPTEGLPAINTTRSRTRMGTRRKLRASRRSPRLAATLLPTPRTSNRKQTATLPETLQNSIASQFSWSSSQGEKRLSIRPPYEPPSVKRRKLRRQSELLPNFNLSPTRTSAAIKRKGNANRRRNGRVSFCPIEASKQSILAEMKKLEEDIRSKKQNNMKSEHLALALKVWDRISSHKKDEKVEAVVSGMATNLTLSHLRLTRFLKGDKDNILSAAQVHRISKKLEDWLKEDE